MENSYHSGNHCKYLIQYHIIWCPKFRYCVLDDAEGTLKQILHRICQKYGYQVKDLRLCRITSISLLIVHRLLHHVM